MNLDNVTSKLTLALTELEQSGIPANNIEKLSFIYLTNLERTLNIKLYSVSKLSDNVIAIGVA